MEAVDNTKVVLVDDHKLFREGMLELVNGFKGYEVIWEAAHGKELLEKLATEGLPDIILLDISMPVMDGFETVRWLGKQYPGIKILVLSMIKDDESVLRLLKSGVNGYLLKNADSSELHAALRAIRKNGCYFTDGINEAMVRSFSRKKEPAGKLSEKEIEFLKLICTDLPYKSFHMHMDVTERDTEYMRTKLFKKLEVNSRVGLVLYAIRQGIFRVE